MGAAQAFGYLAVRQAIEDANLSDDLISNLRTGLVVGMGGFAAKYICEACAILRETHSAKGVSPFSVPRVMTSSISAVLSTLYKIKGVNYSISSACSTSAHSIGHAGELIQMGKQDIVFAGGAEELYVLQTCMFDAMKALSSNYNDNPKIASRAFDAARDGFVISEGASILVLEELEHAKARGATIYAELTGYGATSDGVDMVMPSGEGAENCMKLALNTAKTKPQYINAHGTSTPGGDITELKAVERTFGDEIPYIGSTKSPNRACFRGCRFERGYLFFIDAAK